MTRAEYQAKYGVQPSTPVAVAPIRMTRAEYDQKYGSGKYGIGETQQEKRSRIDTENQQYAQDAKANTGFGAVKNFGKAIVENIAPSEVGLGKSISSVFSNVDKQVQAHNDLLKTNTELRRIIAEREAKGIDVRDLKKSFNANIDLINENKRQIDEHNKGIPTAGQVLGQAGGTLLDVLSAGTYGKAAAGLKTLKLGKAMPALPTAVQAVTKTQGLVKGAKKALPLGYAYDVALGAQGLRGEDRTGAKAFIPGAGTAIAGVIGGAMGADNAAKATRVAKAEELKTQIRKNAVSTYPDAVKAGDLPAEMVYPDGTARINPELAQGRVDDVSANLEKMRSGLGEKFKKSIDVTNTSFEELTGNAEKLIDKAFGGGLGNSVIDKTKATVRGAVTKEGRALNVAKNIENELLNIENNYAKLRKNMEFSKDANTASRNRVARADVLQGAIDAEGTIRTKNPGGAVDQYYDKYLAGSEGVVRNQLEKEGVAISPEIVRIRLEKAIMDSGLEGAALKKALNNVVPEVEGLMLKSTPEGLIPLTLLHDAKISTTKGINYATEPHVKTGSKALANAYKNIIEEKSKTNVKQVNAELAKYLQDMEYLESLDGRKVKGGRLGKYFAQISGNIVGGAVGGAIGGPVGTAVGSVVGGEVGARVKGAVLKNTISDATGLPTVKNPIIEKAIEANKAPTKLFLPAPEAHSKLDRTLQAQNANANSTMAIPMNKTVASPQASANKFQTLIQDLKNEAKNNPNKGVVNLGAPVGGEKEYSLFHTTIPKNVKAIASGGFKTGGKDTIGNAFGEGVYLSTNKKDAELWREFVSGPDKKSDIINVKAKLNIFDPNTDDQTVYWEKLAKKTGVKLEENQAQEISDAMVGIPSSEKLRMKHVEKAREITQKLVSMGYDGASFIEAPMVDEGITGKQIVVFNVEKLNKQLNQKQSLPKNMLK